MRTDKVFVLRIYDPDLLNPARVHGVLERVGADATCTFHTAAELWQLITGLPAPETETEVST